MKLSTLVISTLFFYTSCSSFYRAPETVEQKMDRYKTYNKNKNHVPLIGIHKESLSGRRPASLTKKKKSPYSKVSNKKLYFLTLLSQYNELKKYSNATKVPDINICPSFHTSFYDQKEAYELAKNFNSKIKFYKHELFGFDDDKLVAIYPELALSLNINESQPRVIDIIKSKNFYQNKTEVNNLIQKALNVHLTKTYNELDELCDSGSSDNYYSYENLASHIKNNDGLNPTTKNLESLLKTTLFSNYALIDSLKTRSQNRVPASVKIDETQYLSEVVKRLNVGWTYSYFSNLRKLKKR